MGIKIWTYFDVCKYFLYNFFENVIIFKNEDRQIYLWIHDDFVHLYFLFH